MSIQLIKSMKDLSIDGWKEIMTLITIKAQPH